MKALQAILALFALAFQPLYAASLGDLFLDLNFDGEITITDCDTAATGELVIPDTIDGFPIISIRAEAFWGCNSLTNITIGNRVTSIGSFSFSGCSGLTNITIGSGVTGFGIGTFTSCANLKNISFQGVAPANGLGLISGVPEGAQAYVRYEFADSFGGFGNTWEGLTVEIQRATITNCGFVNATTFFIEFEPAGAGYQVMSSPTLNFGNAVEVTPTLQPTSGSDNRFEFTASGSRNFYRLEPTE